MAARKGTFQPYSQSSNAPKFAGNINKVDASEFTPENSNAKAFGVDIFGNDPQPQKQQQPQYQPKPQTVYNNNNYNHNNSNNNNMNNSPFGKPSPYSQAKPVYNNNNNMNVMPSQQYGHKWDLNVTFDVKKDEIYFRISDEVTGKKWRKFIGEYDVHGKQVKDEYFRINRILSNGKARYQYPPNGIGALQVLLTSSQDSYKFVANQM